MKNAIVLLACLLILASCAPNEKKAEKVEAFASAEISSDTLQRDSATLAYHAFDEYRRRVDSILIVSKDAADAELLPKGFHLPNDEIKKMAARLSAEGGTDSVFAMLAIRYDSKDKPYMTLIFQEKTTKTNSWTYYDYSRPCPPNCPTDQ